MEKPANPKDMSYDAVDPTGIVLKPVYEPKPSIIGSITNAMKRLTGGSAIAAIRPVDGLGHPRRR
jgi:hypothetical protein